MIWGVRLRLMAALCLALLGSATSGCGNGDMRRPAATGTWPTLRLDRPELVVFRVGGPVDGVRFSLVTVRADGARLRTLRTGGDRAPWRPALFERASWAPDGRRVAFTAELGRTFGGCGRDIFVMRGDGSRPRRVTSGGRSFHPVWTPSGRRIFFARRPRGVCSPQEMSEAKRLATATIWSMRPDGSNQRRVTDVVAGRSDIPGSFSPDGGTLAFSRGAFPQADDDGRIPNSRDVWGMRPDGSGAHRLAERAADPTFSPDGDQLAFASDRDENGELSYGDRVFFANELYSMNPDGSSPRRLTRTRALNEAQPSWLPSGTRIAYQRGRVIGNAQGTVVLQANSDGTCPTPILADSRLRRWYAAPSWRPAEARRGAGALIC
jgi:Tol biopolymer transport system component